MTIAYFDAPSGVAGDMLIAAMLDAGLPLKYLLSELKKIPLTDYRLLISKEHRNEILGTLYKVQIEKPIQNHNAALLNNIIEKSCLSTSVKTQSLKILNEILMIQKKVFGLKKSNLFFDGHAAVDLIVDVAGCAIGLDYFSFKQIFASPLPVHRCYPSDTLEAMKGMPLEKSQIAKCLVSITGASVLKLVVTHFGECPLHKIEKVGLGCGHKKLKEQPNVLRLLIGEGFSTVMIEANIDDMNPQWFDYVMERLFAAGVVDVILEPIQMKKNRPGVLLKAISPWDLKEKAIEIILKETTTLGVRYYPLERRILTRELKTVSTRFGDLPVKFAKDGVWDIKKWIPEYEACKEIARRKKIPLRIVYEEVLRNQKQSPSKN